MQLKAYSDPGHGWAAVKRKLLIELGIENRISSHSYQSKTGQTVYLEEDADLSLFMIKMRERGEDVQFITTYSRNDNRSPIRSYPTFQSQTKV